MIGEWDVEDAYKSARQFQYALEHTDGTTFLIGPVESRNGYSKEELIERYKMPSGYEGHAFR